MGKKIDAPVETISSLFNNHLALPDTQRDYTWEKKHVEPFFEDLVDEEALNYIGLIILWGDEKPNAISKENPYLIYDGQQRITSFYVLLIAIRQRLESYEEKEGKKIHAFDKESEQVKNVIFGINRMIKATNERSFTSSPVIKDLIGFMSSLAYWDGKFPIKEKNEKGKLIQKFRSEAKIVRPVYNAFVEQIKDFSLEGIENLVLRIEESQCIVLYLSDVGHANNVFRRVNSTGKDLDIADLIKNEVIGPTKQGKDRVNVLDHWGNVIKNSFKNAEQLIRYNYMVQNGHITTKNLMSELKGIVGSTEESRNEYIINLDLFSKYYENVNNHFDIDKTKDFLNIFNLLESKKTAFDDYLYEIYNYLFAINRYNVSQCQTVIYAYMKKLDELDIEEKDQDGKKKKVFPKYIKNFLRKIEAFHFGANYICGRPGNKVEKPYADFSKRFSEIEVDKEKKEIEGQSSINLEKNITLREDVNKFHEIENELFRSLYELYPTSNTFEESFLELNYMRIIAKGLKKGTYTPNRDDIKKISYILSREAMIDKSSSKYKMRSSAEIMSLLVKEKDRQLSPEDPFEESAWSLDHWFPQNPIGDDGKKMKEEEKQKLINERFDDTTERDISTPYLHSIGNLIYATRKGNTDFGNSLPPEKIIMINDPKNPNNNKSHIKTFVDDYINAHENWNAASVEERAKKLSEYCYAHVWKFKPLETPKDTII